MQKKNLFVVAIAVLGVGLIGLLITFEKVSSEQDELKRLTVQQRDSLLYFHLKTLGDSLLFLGEDALAQEMFERADKIFGQSALIARAETFINRRDRLRQHRRDEFETLRKSLQSTLRSLLAREEDIRSRDTQLRDMTQAYERLQAELSALKKNWTKRRGLSES